MCTSFGSTLDLDTVRHKGWSYKGPSKAVVGLRVREYTAAVPWRSLALLGALAGAVYLGGTVVLWTAAHPFRAWALRTGVRVLWTLV